MSASAVSHRHLHQPQPHPAMPAGDGTLEQSAGAQAPATPALMQPRSTAPDRPHRLRRTARGSFALAVVIVIAGTTLPTSPTSTAVVAVLAVTLTLASGVLLGWADFLGLNAARTNPSRWTKHPRRHPE